MKTAILDFEIASKAYKPYTDGIEALQEKARNHYDKIDSLQNEAMMIAEAVKSLVLDDVTKNSNREKIQRLQQEAMLLDRTFKMDSDEEQKRLIMLAYDSISDIAKEYAISNGFNIVLNRSEVVYFDAELDITDKVIEVIKQKGEFKA